MSYEKRSRSGSSVWNTSEGRQVQEGNRNTKGGWGSSSKMGGMAEGRGLRILGKSSQGGFGFCTEGCATSGRLVCSTLAPGEKTRRLDVSRDKEVGAGRECYRSGGAGLHARGTQLCVSNVPHPQGWTEAVATGHRHEDSQQWAISPEVQDGKARGDGSTDWPRVVDVYTRSLRGLLPSGSVKASEEVGWSSFSKPTDRKETLDPVSSPPVWSQSLPTSLHRAGETTLEEVEKAGDSMYGLHRRSGFRSEIKGRSSQNQINCGGGFKETGLGPSPKKGSMGASPGGGILGFGCGPEGRKMENSHKEDSVTSKPPRSCAWGPAGDSQDTCSPTREDLITPESHPFGKAVLEGDLQCSSRRGSLCMWGLEENHPITRNCKEQAERGPQASQEWPGSTIVETTSDASCHCRRLSKGMGWPFRTSPSATTSRGSLQTPPLGSGNRDEGGPGSFVHSSVLHRPPEGKKHCSKNRQYVAGKLPQERGGQWLGPSAESLTNGQGDILVGTIKRGYNRRCSVAPFQRERSGRRHVQSRGPWELEGSRRGFPNCRREMGASHSGPDGLWGEQKVQTVQLLEVLSRSGSDQHIHSGLAWGEQLGHPATRNDPIGSGPHCKDRSSSNPVYSNLESHVVPSPRRDAERKHNTPSKPSRVNHTRSQWGTRNTKESTLEATIGQGKGHPEVDWEELLRKAEQLAGASIAQSTHLSYSAAFGLFESFTKSYGARALPAAADTIFSFIAWLEVQGKGRRVPHHIAAVSWMHKKKGLTDYTKAVKVQMALQGVARCEAQEKMDVRSPFPLEALKKWVEGTRKTHSV